MIDKNQIAAEQATFRAFANSYLRELNPGNPVFHRIGGETVTATFKVTNNGDRAGSDVSQVYLVASPGETRQRLLGFERVELEPGETKEIMIEADPRLLARFDGSAGQWRIEGGMHRVMLGRNATQVSASADVELVGRLFGK